MKAYDKRYNFNFPIENFLFIFSNITAAPAYGMRKGLDYDYDEQNIYVVICDSNIS
jgi:hypothetical protein